MTTILFPGKLAGTFATHQDVSAHLTVPGACKNSEPCTVPPPGTRSESPEDTNISTAGKKMAPADLGGHQLTEETKAGRT